MLPQMKQDQMLELGMGSDSQASLGLPGEVQTPEQNQGSGWKEEGGHEHWEVNQQHPPRLNIKGDDFLLTFHGLRRRQTQQTDVTLCPAIF